MLDKREYMREWRKAHADHCKAYNAKWVENNPDYHDKWRMDNPDCGNEYRKKWRAKNRKRTNETNKRWASKARVALREYLNTVKIKYGCMNPLCPVTFSLPPYCLDFHHIDKATKSFSLGCIPTASLQKVVAEINKCTVLCALCHREVTWGKSDVQFSACSETMPA